MGNQIWVGKSMGENLCYDYFLDFFKAAWVGVELLLVDSCGNKYD
jgi:hypothetical protein